MREITITTINGLWNETINLGTRGENLATKIMIDISEWAEEFGVGTPQLLVQRPDDSLPYIAVISYIGNIVTWVVTNTDVAQSGIGHLELRYTVNSIVVKSKIFKTCINTSLDEPGPTPAPYTAWVEQVLAAAAAIQVDLSGKQNALIPSTGITIAQDGKTISANIPSYSVSSGLTLANNVFGIDFNTVQQKLTAGSGISINNNVISATGGGGSTSVYLHKISFKNSSVTAHLYLYRTTNTPPTFSQLLNFFISNFPFVNGYVYVDQNLTLISCSTSDYSSITVKYVSATGTPASSNFSSIFSTTVVEI